MSDRARYDGRYPEPPYPEMPPDLSLDLAKAQEEICQLRGHIQILLEENALKSRMQHHYYRCDGCGGIVVRATGNTAPCEKCDKPLGNELVPDVWWFIQAMETKAKLETAVKERDDAREAARFLWDATSPGHRAFYAQCAIEKWPWLKGGGGV